MREIARAILDVVIIIIAGPFIFVGLLCIIIFLLAQFALEWILKRFFNYTPKWAKIPIYPHQDVFIYYERGSENGLRCLDIYSSSNDEEDEYTYPIAKDFIERVLSPYTMLVKVHAANEFIETYRCFLETYLGEKAFTDKEKGLLYLFCDDVNPVFKMLGTQNEYDYWFDVCAFGELPQVESCEDAEKLMAEHAGIISVGCAKLYDEIKIYHNGKAVPRDDILNIFGECCVRYGRRFMSSEEYDALDHEPKYEA